MRLFNSAEEMARLPKGYRPQLDVLRAIAIGLVLVEHFAPGLRDLIPIGPGALGVHLFFVLSGFLITRNFLSRLDRRPAGEVVRDFYITRVARLMPAYYVSLLALCLFGIPEVRDYIWWHVLYASNYLSAVGGPLLVYWSLGVEEQFYLLLPALVLWFNRDAVKVAAILVGTGFLLRLLVLATPIPPFAFEVTIFGNFEILGIGVLIGALTHAGRQLLEKRWFMPLAIGCIIFQSIAWYLWGNGVVRHISFNMTCGIFFAWMILRANLGARDIIGWLSRFGLVRFIGKISYGMYLIHWVFPKIFLSSTIIALVGNVPLVIQGIVVLLLSFFVPAISWIIMESPILRLKDRLLSRQTSISRPEIVEATRHESSF
jgi:peptidoglycan/LPS O-acetylase OafA/YrhL